MRKIGQSHHVYGHKSMASRESDEPRKRRKLNANEIIKKAEAKLTEGKPVKLKEMLLEVKEAIDGVGIEFHRDEWQARDEPVEQIIYVPTGRPFRSAQEAMRYLEDEGTEGARAHLLASLKAKLEERQIGLASVEAWQIEWFAGSIVYQYTGGHRPTFRTESEAIDFATRGYTSRDEEMSLEFQRVLQECRRLHGQVSALFTSAMGELLDCRVPDGVHEAGIEDLQEREREEDDDDDDEDYSEEEEASEPESD